MTLKELIEKTPLNYNIRNIDSNSEYKDYLIYKKEEISREMYNQQRFDLLTTYRYFYTLPLEQQAEVCEKVGYIPESLIFDDNIFNYFIEKENYYMASFSLCCYSSTKLPDIKKYIVENIDNLPTNLFTNSKAKNNYMILREILRLERYDLIEEHIEEILNALPEHINIIPHSVALNKYLFNKALETNNAEIILCFASELITKDLVKQYYEEMYSIIDENPSIVSRFESNREIFNLLLDKKRFDLLVKFDQVLLNTDFLNQYGNEIMTALNDVSYFSRSMRRNADLFNLVVAHNKPDMLLNFKSSLFTPDIFDKFESSFIDIVTTGSTHTFYDNEFLFNELIKRKRFDLLVNFSKDLFTDEIISKYSDELIKIISVCGNIHLDKNQKLFMEVLKKERYETAFEFNSSLFTEDNISEYMDGLLETLMNKRRIPFNITENHLFFNALIKKGNFKLLLEGFDKTLFTEDIIINNFDEIIKVYPDSIPYSLLDNQYLFNELIKRGMIEKVFQMDDRFFTKQLIDENIDKLIELIPTLNNTFKNQYMFDTIIMKRQHYELTCYFSDELYTDEFIKEHIDVIVPMYEKISYPYKLSSRKVVFDEFLKLDRFDLIIKVHKDFFTPEFMKTNIDKIICALDNSLRYGIDNKFIDNQILFDELLKRNRFDMLIYFDKFITNDFIDKYINEIMAALSDLNWFPYGLGINKYFLNKVIENNRNDLIHLFDSSLFTKEFVEEHITDIIDEIKISVNLQRNYNLFTVLFDKKRYDIISKFDGRFFYEDFIGKDLDNVIAALEELPFNSQSNKYLFNETLKRKRFDLVMQFSPAFHTPEFMDKYAEEIIGSARTHWLPQYACSNELLIYCLDHDKDDYIVNFDSSLFIDELLSTYYAKIVNCLKHNKDLFNHLEIENITNFLKLLEQNEEYDILIRLPFPGDILENIEKQTLYANLINISKEELVNRLKQLYSKNDEILNTLLPYFLSDKFASLNSDEIEKFTIYRDLQTDLINVDEKFLTILTRILNILSSKDYDLCAPINSIIKNYDKYKEIIDTIDANTITDEEIKNLIYLMQRNNIYNIKNINELSDANFSKIQEQLFLEVAQKINDNTIDIETLREMLLEKKYGLSTEKAQFICERYYSIPEALADNNPTFNLIKSINNIVKTKDIEELKFYYINSTRLIADFYSIIALESSIRKYFSNMYSSSLYSPKDSDLLNENNDLYKSNKKVYDILTSATYNGHHPQFYIVKDDFRLQTHALGAYRDFEVPKNFEEAWLRPKITYHGICTTYIANNLIAPARPRHVVYGFQNYEDSALLCAGNYDLFSDQVIYNYAASIEKPYTILPPDEMINRTRHTHNEIVIERRNNVYDKSFKRLPDYIVYFVDDINNEENYSENNAIYKETIQASIDHNIPIVIIDRLYFARREEKRCNLLKEEFINNLHPTILKELITNYVNNIISCARYASVNHAEYHDVFTYKKISILINELIDIIINNKRPDLANNLNELIILEELFSKAPQINLKKLQSFIAQNNIEYNNLVTKKQQEDITKKSIINKAYYTSSEEVKEQIYNDLNNGVSLDDVIKKINNEEYGTRKAL